MTERMDLTQVIEEMEHGAGDSTIARWLAALREHQKEDQAREKSLQDHIAWAERINDAAAEEIEKAQSRRFTPEEREALEYAVAFMTQCGDDDAQRFEDAIRSMLEQK